jgi:hypothetical protein
MGRTELSSAQIRNGDVRREDLATTVEGNSVITNVVPTELISIASTGADVGTGQVTLKSNTYVHNQETPESLWYINHNLDKYPAVTIVDSSGRTVGGGVAYPDRNNVIVDFSGGFAGKAYLN